MYIVHVREQLHYTTWIMSSGSHQQAGCIRKGGGIPLSGLAYVS